MKKHVSLIFLGVLNIVHGSMHIFQLIQSIFMASYAFDKKSDSWVHRLMENPWMGLVWACIGVTTLVIGIRDYKHHHHHKD